MRHTAVRSYTLAAIHGSTFPAPRLRLSHLPSEDVRRYTSYHGAYQEAFADTIKQLVRAVYSCIAHRSPGPAEFPTFADGHAALLVHEAALESARQQSWVAVSSRSDGTPVA